VTLPALAADGLEGVHLHDTPLVKVERPTGRTTLTRGPSLLGFAWADGEGMNRLPTSATGEPRLSPRPAASTGTSRPVDRQTGRADDGPLRVIVRTDPRVRRLRIHLAKDEWCDLLPCGEDPAVGVTFFAVLLPGTTAVDSMQGFDADGQELSE
jgi:hypothetical protein